MRIKTHRLAAVASLVLAGGTTLARADEPLNRSYAERDRGNVARIIVGPRLHPEVAVERTLAAQPVHPHLVQLVVGNAQRTDLDPMADLSRDGELRIDENHSLVKAQRLARSLQGVTTGDLAAMRNADAALARPAATANTAKLIRYIPLDENGEPAVATPGTPGSPATPAQPSRPAAPAKDLLAAGDDEASSATHHVTTPDAEARS